MKKYIGYCSEHQLKEMFSRFYRSSNPQLSEEFAKAVLASQSTVSPAQIQGFFMRHKCDPPETVLASVHEIAEVS